MSNSPSPAPTRLPRSVRRTRALLVLLTGMTVAGLATTATSSVAPAPCVPAAADGWAVQCVAEGDAHPDLGPRAWLFQERLNLNTADVRALTALPGVGRKTAQRIVDDRVAHGPFARVAALVRVKGIGPKTLARLEPYLKVK